MNHHDTTVFNTTVLNTLTGYLSFIAAAADIIPTSESHAQQLFADVTTARSRIMAIVDTMRDKAEENLIARVDALAARPAPIVPRG